MFEWHKAEISDVSLEFGTDIEYGRTNMDSKRKRLSNNGVFRIASVDSGLIVRKIASEASFILLILAYIIAAIIGFHVEAFTAIPVLLIAFVASCYIRYYSEKRLYNSRTLLLPRTKIIENGKKLRLSSLDVEVGDLIIITKGDVIPADARLVYSENLTVAEPFYNEITEKIEHKHIRKNHELLYSYNNASEEYDNMVYASSDVISGRGKAIVTATGNETRAGRFPEWTCLSTKSEMPKIWESFENFTKRFSLSTFCIVLVFSLVMLYLSTRNATDGGRIDIMNALLALLAVWTTSMSEIISAPSLAIFSYTLFGGKRNVDNGITKLAHLEELAETDTLLILCPDIITDKNHLVRRIYISDNEYRFESLKAVELDAFVAGISRYLSNRRNYIDHYERRALTIFARGRKVHRSKNDTTLLPPFIKVNDFDSIMNCEFFRTDGGSQWRFTPESKQRLSDSYQLYLNLGLNVFLYISTDNNQSTFEGMVAVGEEYPFSDGDVFSECINNGVSPVLVLEAENDASIKFALNCGIVDSIDKIVFASELAKSNLLLTEVSSDTTVYIGFGKSGAKEIFDNLTNHGRKVLPVIKDLADKGALSSIGIYSTHAESSADAVKRDSTLSLRRADAEKRCGGISDAIRSIMNSKLACLKLNVFKNYLIFTTVFRLALVLMTLLITSSVEPMTALLILLSGFLADGAALLVVSTIKAIPSASAKLEGSKYSIIYAVAGIFIAVISYFTSLILISVGGIDNTPLFGFYSSIMSQQISLAAFMIVLKNKVRSLKFNIAYTCFMIINSIYLLVQNWFPDAIYQRFESLAYSRITLSALPFIFLPGAISLVIIILIDKLIHRNKSDSE